MPRASVKKRARGSRGRAALRQTVEGLVQHAARRLSSACLMFGHGLASPHDEAAFLVMHALGLHPDELVARLSRRPTQAQIDRVLRLVERRIAERKPAAYLTGVAWLGGLRFRINENVIVPRSYIAELLHDDLRPWIAPRQRIRSALDLCTGSGCLAILLAHSFPKARIDAADISADALRVARRNVADYHLKHRIRLVRSNLYDALKGRRYDLIVSNPPYVSAASMQRLPQEYRHEPRLALAGGPEGLDYARRILLGASAHLSRGGMLVMEVGHNRARVERAFPRLPFIWPSTSGGDDCVLVISREALAAQNP